MIYNNLTVLNKYGVNELGWYSGKAQEQGQINFDSTLASMAAQSSRVYFTLNHSNKTGDTNATLAWVNIRLDGANAASYAPVPPIIISVVTGPVTSPKYTFTASANLGSVTFTFNSDQLSSAFFALVNNDAAGVNNATLNALQVADISAKTFAVGKLLTPYDKTFGKNWVYGYVDLAKANSDFPVVVTGVKANEKYAAVGFVQSLTGNNSLPIFQTWTQQANNDYSIVVKFRMSKVLAESAVQELACGMVKMFKLLLTQVVTEFGSYCPKARLLQNTTTNATAPVTTGNTTNATANVSAPTYP